MDIAIRQEPGSRRVGANARQLNEATSSRGRETSGFLGRCRILSKSILRVTAFGLAATLASAFSTSVPAADLTGPLPLRAPPSVAASFDWTGAYFGGHVGYSRGYGCQLLKTTLSGPRGPLHADGSFR